MSQRTLVIALQASRVLVAICVLAVVARASQALDLSQKAADCTMLGARAYDGMGTCLASGDLNGDSNVDIIVSSQGPLGSSGYAFFNVLWGGEILSGSIDFATSSSTAVVRAVAGDMGIASRATTGDFNHDGFDDVVLGLPCRFPFSNCDGKAYIVYGTPSFPDSLYLGNPTVNVTTIRGIAGMDGGLGLMMAAGDVNGDGFDDLIISAPEMQSGGQIYLLIGRASMPTVVLLGTAPLGVTYVIEPRYSINSGTGLACGDINRDGYDDVVVGAPDAGEVMLVFGAPSLPDTILLSSPTVKRLHGGVGLRVDVADFDGDSYTDIVASKSFYPEPVNCEGCGGAIVLYGGGSLPDVIDVDEDAVPITRLLGTGFSTHYGFELSSGDVNGDGFDDILVGSQPDEYEIGDVGDVTMVYGSDVRSNMVLLAQDPTVMRVEAETREDGFAGSLLAQDVNEDGVDDVIIGALSASPPNRPRAGKSYLLYGDRTVTQVRNAPIVRNRLGQNYPNPFNPATFIELRLNEEMTVSLAIYDVAGKVVKHVYNGRLGSAVHKFAWGATNDRGEAVASGVYFIILETPTGRESRRMTLIR